MVVVGLLTQDEYDKMDAVGSVDAGEWMVLKWLSDLGAASNLTGIGAPGILSLYEIVRRVCGFIATFRWIASIRHKKPALTSTLFRLDAWLLV